MDAGSCNAAYREYVQQCHQHFVSSEGTTRIRYMGFQRAKTKLAVGHRLKNIRQGERLHVAATMRIEGLSASPHTLS